MYMTDEFNTRSIRADDFDAIDHELSFLPSFDTCVSIVDASHAQVWCDDEIVFVIDACDSEDLMNCIRVHGLSRHVRSHWNVVGEWAGYVVG